MRWIAIAIACVGCRQLLGFDEPSAVSDGPPISDTGSGEAGPDAFACPSNYSTLLGAPSFYRLAALAGEKTNWLDAEATCRAEGPGIHLAIAETAAEHTAFEDAVTGASIWLGVTDRITDTNWIPIIGGTEASWFADWITGVEPGPSATDNCALLDRAQVDENLPCNGTDPQFFEGYLCECDNKAVDLSTF